MKRQDRTLVLCRREGCEVRARSLAIARRREALEPVMVSLRMVGVERISGNKWED